MAKASATTETVWLVALHGIRAGNGFVAPNAIFTATPAIADALVAADAARAAREDEVPAKPEA